MNNFKNPDIFKINFLVHTLNKYANAYYNGTPIATDEEYDKMYETLKQLEKETGYKLANSPIDKVGFEVQDSVEKVQHVYPMLSLKKIHSIEEIKDFAQNHECIMSLKEDGLTIRLTYQNGKLIKAETRGDGNIGSDITYNIKAFQNVPFEVQYKEDFIIDGEAIITDKDFKLVNEGLDKPFALQRSLASGSVALLDPEVTKTRRLTFIAWKIVSGYKEKTYLENFEFLKNLGFLVVPHVFLDINHIEDDINILKDKAKEVGHPIDGIVITYNDIDYGDSLGKTEHHFNNGVAYKFEDEVVETVLTDIEWSMGRTGDLTPVAIFNPVIIDGTEVTRASCHNLTYLKNMCLGIGDKIGVYKANMIIPQIRINYTNSSNFNVPILCPYCNHFLKINKDNETEVLHCSNDDCSGKLLGKITHYVSKPAMNIDGISENTIKTLINMDIIHNYKDLYYLESYKEELMELQGYGPKKVTKMLEAIEKSRECKLENFLISLGIHLIGKSASKIISKQCNGDINILHSLMKNGYDWTNHDGFGKEMAQSFYDFWVTNIAMIKELAQELKFIVIDHEKNVEKKGNSLNDKTFCITGSLIEFKNREECENYIVSNGGKIVSGVTKKTNYLICNEASTSSKYKKAQDLKIHIITEIELKDMIGE